MPFVSLCVLCCGTRLPIPWGLAREPPAAALCLSMVLRRACCQPLGTASWKKRENNQLQHRKSQKFHLHIFRASGTLGHSLGEPFTVFAFRNEPSEITPGNVQRTILLSFFPSHSPAKCLWKAPLWGHLFLVISGLSCASGSWTCLLFISFLTSHVWEARGPSEVLGTGCFRVYSSTLSGKLRPMWLTCIFSLDRYYQCLHLTNEETEAQKLSNFKGNTVSCNVNPGILTLRLLPLIIALFTRNLSLSPPFSLLFSFFHLQFFKKMTSRTIQKFANSCSNLKHWF